MAVMVLVTHPTGWIRDGTGPYMVILRCEIAGLG